MQDQVRDFVRTSTNVVVVVVVVIIIIIIHFTGVNINLKEVFPANTEHLILTSL
jgi:hypothetical protein